MLMVQVFVGAERHAAEIIRSADGHGFSLMIVPYCVYDSDGQKLTKQLPTKSLTKIF